MEGNFLDIKPLINKLLERGVGWLSNLISATDHSLTKASIFLQKKGKEIEDYMIDRGKLLSAIQLAQNEIDSLRSVIDENNIEQTENMLLLHEKLEQRTEELLNNQQQLSKLHKSVEKSKNTISELSVEKEQAVNDRKLLRSEYNNLQNIINDNLMKQEELKDEIASLKTNVITGQINPNQHQIREHEDRIEYLQQENIDYEKRYTDIQEQLKEKMSLVVQLNGQLQQAEIEINEKQSQVIILEQKAKDFQGEIRNYSLQTKKLKKDLARNKVEMKTQKQKSEELYVLINELSIKLNNTDLKYLENMIKTDEEIKVLKNNLLDEQNNLAIEKERNGAPAEITPEALRVLEQEYEPRFQTLYQSSFLHDEFYRDFFSMIPSDRLRVEACIVNLNFNYDQHMYKVRPNTVKTRASTTINEYPFGHDKIGRIYFKRDNGKVNFYRISRTKNGKGSLDQERVIEWLKRNK